MHGQPVELRDPLGEHQAVPPASRGYGDLIGDLLGTGIVGAEADALEISAERNVLGIAHLGKTADGRVVVEVATTTVTPRPLPRNHRQHFRSRVAEMG